MRFGGYSGLADNIAVLVVKPLFIISEDDDDEWVFDEVVTVERCCILVAAASAAADEDEIIDIVLLLALMGLQVARSNEVAAVVINTKAIVSLEFVVGLYGRE